MKVEIKFLRGGNDFGRPMLFGQLYNVTEERVILDGAISQLLQAVKSKNLDLVNSKEILETMVLTYGFAS